MTTLRHTLCHTVCVFALMAAASQAFAANSASANTATEALPSTNSDTNIQGYSAAYFSQYQVSNALDMVTNVPGFNFARGEEARGFSGTLGNVLIDGQRPASKSGLENSLSLISASQVERIELITGGASGIDMGGHRQVVNVIRKAGAKPNINLSVTARYHEGVGTRGVLGASYSKNADDIATDFTAAVFSFVDDGVNDAKRDRLYASGVREHLSIDQEAGGVGIESQFSHARPLFGGKLSFNVLYNPTDYNQDSLYTDKGVAVEHFDYKEIESETGLQYEYKFNDQWAYDLNLLRRHGRTSIFDHYVEGSDVSDYRSLTLGDEHILSGKLTWKRSPTLSYALGTESVYNGRNETSRFTVNAANQNIPSSTVLVEEERTESYVTMNWEAHKRLNMETELRVETSTISVAQSQRSDSFVYLKPRVQLVYSLDETSKLTWRTQRRVEQLGFEDFATKIELQNNNVTLGNSELVPQKSWVSSLIYEHTFWKKGALTLKFEHQAIEDTNDQVAIIDGSNIYSANGNLGKGRRDVISLDADIPLDRLGAKEATLKFNLQARDSNVYDPIIGKNRPISRIEPYKYDFNFTQNYSALNIKWGVNLQAMDSEEIFRANEHLFFHYAPWLQLWGEYKTKSNLQFIVRINNPFGLHYDYDRTVFTGLRGKSSIAYEEHQSGVTPPMVMLKLKKEL